MTIKTFDELQHQATIWHNKNFPNKNELSAGLVAAEEAAEASAAMSRLLVKTRQGIRQDEPLDLNVKNEFADALIAFSGYCDKRNWNLSNIIDARAKEIFSRSWTNDS